MKPYIVITHLNGPRHQLTKDGVFENLSDAVDNIQARVKTLKNVNRFEIYNSKLEKVVFDVNGLVQEKTDRDKIQEWYAETNPDIVFDHPDAYIIKQR
jgi:hypothetical protein